MSLLVNRPSLNTEILSDLEANALKSSAMIKVAKATVLAPSIVSTDELKKNDESHVRDTRNAVATVAKIAQA